MYNSILIIIFYFALIVGSKDSFFILAFLGILQLPTLLIFFKNNKINKWNIITLLVPCILAGIYTGDFYLFAYSIVSVLVSTILIYYSFESGKFGKTILNLSATFLFLFITHYIIEYKVYNNDIIVNMYSFIDNSKVEYFKAIGQDTKLTKDLIEEAFVMFKFLLPSFIFIICMLISFINYTIFKKINWFLKCKKLENMQSAIDFRVSKIWLLIYFIVAIIASYVNEKLYFDIHRLFENALSIGTAVIIFSGLMFSIYVVISSKAEKIYKFAIYIIIASLFFISPMIFIFLGLFDTIFNLRKKKENG